MTGSASGIGAATAASFLEKGDVVVGLDRAAQAEPPGTRAGTWAPQTLDVSDAHAVDSTFDRILADHGRIDVLVTSAAVGFPEPFGSMSTESWDRVFRINVTGTMLCIKKALPGMVSRRSGSVAVVSSVAGRTKSVTNGAHYTTSKYGLVGLTRHLAAELAGTGVRINCVAPGPTNSPILTAHTPPEAVEKIKQGTPLGRIAEPQDVANVIAFVTSPAAKQIHGAVLDVNGGLY
ncbi:SDR family NAD(P)-dependent oxidoreductase [Georgenia alba]|uniref:SDR family NAD(P)-dependent oxidoreductase n=1 Tax=Georgenia alba TaxID=2233858 RepID=A0ABW2Q3X2_9MICO